LAACLSVSAILRRGWLAAVVGALLALVLTGDRAWADDGFVLATDDYANHPNAESLWEGWVDKGNLFWSQPPGPLALTVDYLIRPMFDSYTSRQFGTPPGYYRGDYAPLSKLDWCLDSAWTGFRFGLEEANSAAHFSWLTPMGQKIAGGMYDFDWNIDDTKPIDPSRLDSLSRSSERWTDGQMLDLEYEFRLWTHPLGMPADIWPLIGYRWQRFNAMSYGGVQLVPPDGPFPPPFDGDGIAFKQEYSIGYVGAQLRGRWDFVRLPPIAWTVQGDWGYTRGNSIDHHLLRGVPDRYSMEYTDGNCWHAGFTAEALFCQDRFAIGLEGEYLDIHTQGTHHLLIESAGVNEAWDNGVQVISRQIWLTLFLRLRI
jgi:hypothetical protein